MQREPSAGQGFGDRVAAILAVVCGLGGALVAGAYLLGVFNPATAIAPASAPVPPSSDVRQTLLADRNVYDTIAVGASYEAVVAMLGGPGALQSESSTRGVGMMTIRTWTSTSGAEIEITFLNGRVYAKRQSGMPDPVSQ